MTNIEIYFNDGRLIKYEIDENRNYGITAISYAFVDKQSGDTIQIFPISVSMIRIIKDGRSESIKTII